MRRGRPLDLATLERDHMFQLSGSARDFARESGATFGTAREFAVTARECVDHGRLLPAVSNYHEAARLAVTAIATSRGRRFGNAAGAHEAVVDYALAIGLVDVANHAMLDQLRELRHQVNYPADLIEPTDRDLRTMSELVERLLEAVTTSLQRRNPTKVPPPPRG